MICWKAAKYCTTVGLLWSEIEHEDVEVLRPRPVQSFLRFIQNAHFEHAFPACPDRHDHAGSCEENRRISRKHTRDFSDGSGGEDIDSTYKINDWVSFCFFRAVSGLCKIFNYKLVPPEFFYRKTIRYRCYCVYQL